MDLQIRTATEDDLPAMAVADGRAFGVHYREQDLADIRLLFNPARFLLACDGDGRIVGITVLERFRPGWRVGRRARVGGEGWWCPTVAVPVTVGIVVVADGTTLDGRDPWTPTVVDYISTAEEWWFAR